jgi:ParB-like chromosome segregation protein Spo0J
MRTIPLTALTPDPQNARAHDAQNKRVVGSSVQEFGFLGSIVVEKGTGRILAGNARTEQAIAHGIREAVVVEYDPRTQAIVVEADLHGQDATRFALADNRSSELATWDEGVLRALLAEAGPMDDLGWSTADLARVFDEAHGVAAGADDRPAQQGTYAVLVTCDGERHQRDLLEQFAADGLEVRAWNL